jgi:hypothetical protein
MANTVIQLKWSEVTASPTTLNVAEPAYSNSSGKLFIGDNNQNPVLVGGKYYVDRVDEASSSNTANVIVKRATDGGFSATYVRAALFGNANTATTLQTARTISVTGDVDANSVSFDGSQNIQLNLELTNTGVTAGNYGGASEIPVFAVDVDGRITSAANATVATALSIKADTGSNSIALLNDTLTFVGGDGITTSINPSDNVKFDVDNTVIRTTGGQVIEGSLTISGNLIVSGQTTTQNVTTYSVADPLLYLAANNYVSDSVDIGFAGNYYDGSTQRHTGVIRKHGTDNVYIFTNYDKEFDTNLLNVSDPSLRLANTYTNVTGGKVFGLSQVIAIADGGTNQSSFNTGNLVFFNGTSLTSIANTGVVAGTYGSADRTQVVQVDNYGRVVALTNTAIAIDTSQVVTGVLPIARGGTNQTSYTTGAMLQFNGTSIASLANTGTAGTYANASHVPVITTDVYGRVSAVTNTAIAIDTSQITSGTLGVARGGSGASSFATKGVIVSDNASGTGALSALTSATEGHVLQINASGVPTFAHLNGGYF